MCGVMGESLGDILELAGRDTSRQVRQGGLKTNSARAMKEGALGGAVEQLVQDQWGAEPRPRYSLVVTVCLTQGWEEGKRCQCDRDAWNVCTKVGGERQ